MEFGHYYLGQNFHEIKNENLRELSKDEYIFLPRNFPDEKIFHCEDTNFFEQEWHTIISVTANKIYRIALALKSATWFLNSPKVSSGRESFDSIKEYFVEKLGKPNEYKSSEHSQFYIWESSEGNLILEVGKKIDGGLRWNKLNIFLNSSISFPSCNRNKEPIKKANKGRWSITREEFLNYYKTAERINKILSFIFFFVFLTRFHFFISLIFAFILYLFFRIGGAVFTYHWITIIKRRGF